MSNQYLTLAEVRDLLTEEHENRELVASQKNAMGHAMTVCKLPAADARKLVEEIVAIEGVSEYAAVKVADLLPKYPEDVRAIFSKERIAIDPKTINQVIEVVSKYL